MTPPSVSHKHVHTVEPTGERVASGPSLLLGECALNDDPLNTVDDEGDPLAVKCDDCGKWACEKCASRVKDIDEEDSDDENGTTRQGCPPVGFSA